MEHEHGAERDRSLTDPVGWHPSFRTVFWAAMGGLIAALLIGIPMHLMGMIERIPADLVRSDNVWVGWLVHLVAGAIVGGVYGLFVATRSYTKGALYGAAYGLLVGIVLVLVLANLATGRAVPLDTQGVLQVMIHVMWGVVVGLVQASGLRADEQPGTRRTAGRTGRWS